MSSSVVTVVAVASIVGYMALALALRDRAIRARGASLRDVRGLAASTLPLFVWVPYVVIALRPGPEVDVPLALRWVGVALIVLGAAVAAWAALTLGRHFDMHVEVHRGHEVVRAGPYAIVRHPVYAGLALHLVGACVATGDLVLILGTVGVAIPAFAARARAEESLLRAELGDAYDRYSREVPMLLPFVRPRY